MAEAKTLSQFKAKLAGGGARSSLFEVTIPSFPSSISEAWRGGDTGESGIFTFMCRAAAIPQFQVNSVDVPFRGRMMKVAGERIFEDWTVSVYNDETFRIRTAFERWSNAMNKLTDNTGVSDPTSYMADAYVQQLGRGATSPSRRNEGGENVVLRTYKMYDIWPTTISNITLSYEEANQIEQFDVTFKVQYVTVGDAVESSGGATGEVRIN